MKRNVPQSSHAFIHLAARVFERPNMALNLAPFGRWTLRDKAAQRRLA